MGDIEEDLEDDHQMPVVGTEVDSVVLAAGSMRRNENIMKALWSVEYVLFFLQSRRSVEFPTRKV
jgi:hypothetical protein